MHTKTLREFLDDLPRGDTVKFAAELGITSVYLSQLAAKQHGREPSPELCVRIEQLSERVVPRQRLREDWARIWPELIGTAGAPAIPVAEGQGA